MDISNIDAYTAYSPKEPLKQTNDGSLTGNQSQDASKPDPNPAATSQNAFEVNITQTAQDRLSAETTAQTGPREAAGPDQDPAELQKTRKLVDIIA
jgi:hypothetical protein